MPRVKYSAFGSLSSVLAFIGVSELREFQEGLTALKRIILLLVQFSGLGLRGYLVHLLCLFWVVGTPKGHLGHLGVACLGSI